MSPLSLQRLLVATELLLAAATFAALLRIVAPYGRHRRAGFGPSLPARLGWILMESPALLFFAAVYAAGSRRAEPVPLLLAGLWAAHYLHRAAFYPLRLRSAHPMPALVVLLGFSFNLLNGWINARWISALGSYPASWLADPRFVVGALLFTAGMATNLHSDRLLTRLRAPGETGYRTPRGGLFEWVSCPNYLGEIVEWAGWAVATWSPAGLAFALYTAANLVPRALAHHAWYRAHLPDYPASRRALLPYLL